jgi:glyoxylate carboligase
MFKPVAKWADMVLTPEAVPEMLRKSFKVAHTERPNGPTREYSSGCVDPGMRVAQEK